MVVAEKRKLGQLRDALVLPAKSGIELRELAKDLTRLSLPELQAHLAEAGLVPARQAAALGQRLASRTSPGPRFAAAHWQASIALRHTGARFCFRRRSRAVGPRQPHREDVDAMYSLRHLLIAATLLVSFLPAAFAQPPDFQPPAAEAADRPALGVLVAEIPFEQLDSLGLGYGVEVTRVLPGSPAEVAGLRAGDVLVELDGLPLFSVPRLRWLVGQAATNVPLAVTYNRDGTATTVKITPRRTQAAAPPSPHWQPQVTQTAPSYLGVKLQALTPGLRKAFEVAEGTGALVAEVYAGSPADKAGLRAGDVIVKMDRRTIHDSEDVQRVVDYFDPGEPVKVKIIRDRKNQTLTVELGERAGARGNDAWRSWQYPEPGSMPFFVDPDWWREMEDFMEQWRHYWEGSRDESGARAL